MTAPLPADPREELARLAQLFYGRGWMVGTAGNLSARLATGEIWITASGAAKGELTSADFVRVSPGGDILERGHPGARPSAETAVHLALYELFPEAGACLHVHSVENNLVSRFASGEDLALPPLEMLKGLGIPDEHPEVALPVFDNLADLNALACQIKARFVAVPPPVPALLIRHHGVTVWAPTLHQARHRLELIEFLLRYLLGERALGLGATSVG